LTFNKDQVKEQLEFEDVYTLLEDLDAEPQIFNDTIHCLTICHGGDSHKLYYYNNTQLFRCYTHCGDAFDIFDLISRVKDIDLNTSIYYVVNFFNIQHKLEEVEDELLTEEWKLFKRYKNLRDITINNDKIKLPDIDPNILSHYPQPRYGAWESEYISKEVCDYMNIHYDPVSGGILIPHYDENDRMIGIRERTLVQENEVYGKYRPIKINGKLANHPLSFALYGLNKAKDRIKEIGVAMVFESEKAVLQSIGYLGLKNNIAVGMCGSTLSNYQFHLLLDAGAKEICIGVDRDFNNLYDEEYVKVLKKMEKMYQKYSPSCNISFMLDIKGLTGYKHSPTDDGREIFLNLWENRLIPNG
jgi:hypothetical protein